MRERQIVFFKRNNLPIISWFDEFWNTAAIEGDDRQAGSQGLKDAVGAGGLV